MAFGSNNNSTAAVTNPAAVSALAQLLGGGTPTATPTTREKRSPSKFWVNVGVSLPGMGEDGEDMFVSLPFGIPLDDMQHVPVTGGPRKRHLAQTKNLLLDYLRDIAGKMEPGAEQPLELTTCLRRVGEEGESVATDGSNPYTTALAKALGGK